MRKLGHLLVMVAMATATSVSDAGMVTKTFTATVDASSPFAGTVGTGSFTYDDSLLTGIGDEEIDFLSGLMIEFTIFGQTFTESDDIDLPDEPSLEFLDGVPEFLDFIIDERAFVTNPVPIIEPNVVRISFGSLTPAPIGGPDFISELSVEVTTIPEPTSFALFGLGTLTLFARRSRRQGVSNS
ncbi:PEP-CTERM sorting domain-containing protein [Thalassoglobus sp. JC818]|uniref:PEP-CTERM sorting domain-containing protein n=1 Tax=Thalassoglobus sp. JC818 TaxID=3232136 RepID=UPI0034583749